MIKILLLVVLSPSILHSTEDTVAKKAKIDMYNPSTDNDVLRRSIMRMPRSLNPKFNTYIRGLGISYDAFEGMLTLDRHGNPVAGVAEKWYIAPGHTSITFHIKKNARWSDGTPVTSRDFVQSVLFSINRANRTRNAESHFYIKNAQKIYEGKAPKYTLGIKAVGRKILKITFEHPMPHILQYLAQHPTHMPAHAGLLKKYGKDWVKKTKVSNGPYKLDQVGQYKISLVKNPYYHSKNKVAIKKVEYVKTQQPKLFYMNKKVDVAVMKWEYNLADLRKEFQGTNELFSDNSLGLAYISVNPKLPMKIRQAIRLAFDVTKIANLLKCYNSIHGLVPSYIKDYKKNPAPLYKGKSISSMSYEKRLIAARSILRSLGYNEYKPYQLTYSDTKFSPLVGNGIREMLRDANINVKLNLKPYPEYKKAYREGKYELAYKFTYIDYPSTYAFLEIFDSNSVSNYSGLRDDEIDRLIAIAPWEKKKARRATFNKIQKLVLNQFTIIPFGAFIDSTLVSPRVSGWASSITSIHPSRWLKFVNPNKR